jgi:hypothetical protein
MNKIRLNIEQLDVLSFATEQVAAPRGTVQAAATGYTCYFTVAVVETRCLAYPQSYWGEYSCTCPPVRWTETPDCLPIETANTCLDTAQGCLTGDPALTC